MSQYARVNSVVMLKQLRSSLASFSETASTALDEVNTEIQRALAWLHEDRRRYWKNQVRLHTERYVQAKLALKRKGMFDIALTGLRSTAVDEKKALAVAERQLQEAKRRLARTQSWILQIEKELSDYRATVHGLFGALDLDIPNARAKLAKMIDSLEAYTALAPPEMAASADEKQQDNVLQPEENQTTVFRTTSSASEAKREIRTLRETTPSLEIRTKTALGPGPVDWLVGISVSEALRQVAREGGFKTSPPQLEEKILAARPKNEPSVVYLERIAAEAGDCGWYIGVEGETELAEYTAIRVDELLSACSSLTELLSLPVGSLVLIGAPAKAEILYDAQDNVLWQSTNNDGPIPEE